MNLIKWKLWVSNKAELLIKRPSTPLPMKELAWKGLLFATKCGRSNPVSFALRPLALHKKLRLAVGLNLIVMILGASLWGTTPLLAQDEQETLSVISMPKTPVSLATQVRIKFPLPNRDMSQAFWLLHPGVDWRTPVGTPVYAIMSGTVIETEYSKYGYGNKIVISHGTGYETLYAHLSKIDVAVGEKVTTDKIIGESGNTGKSTGPHVHIEIRENGRPINPLLVLGSK